MSHGGAHRALGAWKVKTVRSASQSAMLGVRAREEKDKHLAKRVRGLGEMLNNLKIIVLVLGTFRATERSRVMAGPMTRWLINKRQPSTPPLVTRGMGTACSGCRAGPLALGMLQRARPKGRHTDLSSSASHSAYRTTIV